MPGCSTAKTYVSYRVRQLELHAKQTLLSMVRVGAAKSSFTRSVEGQPDRGGYVEEAACLSNQVRS